jgi:IclR family KDG regulon transcriptional repressor
MVKREQAETSLERALAILEMASKKPGGLTNADIHRRLAVPTSSCSYVLSRLERAGYLRRSAFSRRYELGLKILTVAHGALRDMGLRAIAEPILHNLARQTGFSGLMGVLQNGQVVIVDKIEQPSLAEIDFEIGVTLPAHATALGKMLLASLKPAELKMFLTKYKLSKKSIRTIDSCERLLKELDIIRRRGYSTSDGELIFGICGLAAPISDSAGNVCAGLSLVGANIPLEDPTIIRAVKEASKLISRQLTKAALNTRSFEAGLHALSSIAHL